MIIPKLVFKIYRAMFKYPCRSEVRLALQKSQNHHYGLTYIADILYICGEDIPSISEWLGVAEDKVKEILNALTEEG